MPSGSSARGRDAQRKAAQLLREDRARERRRRILMWSSVGTLAAVAIAAITVTFALNSGTHSRAASAAPATPAPTANGKTTSPPWPAPDDAATRVKAAGLEMLNQEGTVEHIHAHLSVSVDGRSLPVPALIGIDEAAQTISPLHTHDDSGIIHVESPVKASFTLGQFFTEWDVALTGTRIGSLTTAGGEAITTFVGGKEVSGNPAAIVLNNKDDIDIVVAQDGVAVHAPASFTWPSGY